MDRWAVIALLSPPDPAICGLSVLDAVPPPDPSEEGERRTRKEGRQKLMKEGASRKKRIEVGRKLHSSKTAHVL